MPTSDCPPDLNDNLIWLFGLENAGPGSFPAGAAFTYTAVLALVIKNKKLTLDTHSCFIINKYDQLIKTN